MFAVLRSGGKQYKVQQGDVLCLEKIQGKPGDSVAFSDIFILGEGDRVVVNPLDAKKISIKAHILDVFKDKKVLVFKKKRRKTYKRFAGHRQWQTRIKIDSFSGVL